MLLAKVVSNSNASNRSSSWSLLLITRPTFLILRPPQLPRLPQLQRLPQPINHTPEIAVHKAAAVMVVVVAVAVAAKAVAVKAVKAAVAVAAARGAKNA